MGRTRRDGSFCVLQSAKTCFYIANDAPGLLFLPLGLQHDVALLQCFLSRLGEHFKAPFFKRFFEFNGVELRKPIVFGSKT